MNTSAQTNPEKAKKSLPVIDIEAELRDGALRIMVANDLAGDDPDDLPDTEGAGVGIDNVRHRLQAVFGRRATLTAGEANGRFVATIAIPNVTLVP